MYNPKLISKQSDEPFPLPKLIKLNEEQEWHEELDCSDRDIIIYDEEEFDEGYGCQPCRNYKLADDSKSKCVYPSCDKETQFTTKNAKCVNCEAYKTPYYKKFNSGRLSSYSKECREPLCDKNARDYITETGECDTCPEYQTPSADKKSCA